jgi:hypothetical protein
MAAVYNYQMVTREREREHTGVYTQRQKKSTRESRIKKKPRNIRTSSRKFNWERERERERKWKETSHRNWGRFDLTKKKKVFCLLDLHCT